MAYEPLQGLSKSREEHFNDGAEDMVFMSRGVQTGCMGGLNTADTDVGFGSKGDIFDGHFCIYVATAENTPARCLNMTTHCFQYLVIT